MEHTRSHIIHKIKYLRTYIYRIEFEVEPIKKLRHCFFHTLRAYQKIMGEENTLVLHGMWASPFAKRVELALKIKGIPFEYVEEDLMNKNPNTILKYNPVYKKVPVIVHNGNPICESLVILEYIEEVWKNDGPSLLPQDPYKRAKLRFWADFIHKQVCFTLF